MTDRIFLIAEVGSNFAGDRDLAERYIDAAAEAGADAVKFQTLHRDTLMAPYARDPQTGAFGPNPRYAKFSNIGLPENWHAPLKAHAESRGVEFMSTPFHLGAVAVMEAAGVGRYKIASGDLTFTPLLEAVGATGKPVILSTGASHLEEVETAVAALQAAGARDITLLHCVASYPPSFEELNLRAIPALGERFGLPVGLSDHSPGPAAPIAAAALGARTIEKHVTFDRTADGPDHPFAMEFAEFAAMAADLRRIETALGDGIKRPAPSEENRRKNLRRGIYDPETFQPAETGIWLRPQHG